MPNGSARELPEGSTALDLAESIGKRLAKAAVDVTVDGAETDLTRPITDGATVSITGDQAPAQVASVQDPQDDVDDSTGERQLISA